MGAKSHPGLTAEARENRLISLAMDAAEQQLRDGTASPLVIAHFLKLGSQKAALEIERLKAETAMLHAKKSSLEAEERMGELYQNAVEAMQKYNRSDDDYD